MNIDVLALLLLGLGLTLSLTAIFRRDQNPRAVQALIGLLLAGGVLRLYHATLPSLWLDEFGTFWAVNTTSQMDDGRNEVFINIAQIAFRGVLGNTQQRNFFPARLDFDSYNLDRFDYARGPNSILFGNGSIGGTANVVTKRAQPERSCCEQHVLYCRIDR